METIKIKDLDTGYKGKSKTHVITRGINASIDSGELTCLLGANGAGKSTLLHTLSGFLPKISGTIKIMDKEIADYSERSLAKVISVVLTEKCALRNMKVTEMVGLGRSPYTGFWGTLDNEDKKKPYTDDELTEILKQKGYPIARRTIAKYRQQMNIPVARLRR